MLDKTEKQFATFLAACVVLWLAVSISTPLFTVTRKSRRPPCLNNLKQIGLSLQQRYVVNEGPAPLVTREGNDPPRSWRVDVLPFLDHSALYRSYQHDAAWDSPANHQLARQELKVYRCPDNRTPKDSRGRWYSSYAGVSGPQTFFDADRLPTYEEVAESDGTENTIIVVEACGQNIVWTEPRDVTLGVQPLGVNLPAQKSGTSPGIISGPHGDAAHISMASGATRTISSKIDPKVLRALLTATGGESVDGSAY